MLVAFTVLCSPLPIKIETLTLLHKHTKAYAVAGNCQLFEGVDYVFFISV